MMRTKTEIRFNLDNIDDAAGELLRNFPDARIFAFYGEMGAGKTTFIKALCRNLEIDQYVTSPTFALINEYHTKDAGIVFHFDFYRIESIEEVMDMGYEDYFFSNSMCFIEWPERVAGLLPEDTVRIKIEVLDTRERQLRMF